MSRKSVPINIPAPGAAPAVIPNAPALKTSQIDTWVAQAADASEAIGEDVLSARPPSKNGGVTVTVHLTTEPNWSEALKIFFFLPQAAFWFWSIGMIRRLSRGPYNLRR
ncbi:MAG TPA: hypothetical protein VMU18_06765 [Rhodoblastus sp.]|nr:hypothetical protein [Rhodoblastus sp.]